MGVQTAIAVPEKRRKAAHFCQWCGQPAVADVMVTPADINKATKEVRRAEIRAWVCSAHKAMVERASRCSELEAERTKLRKKLADMDPRNNKRPDVVRRLQRIDADLDELA